jgi:cytochrome c peroxidase
MRRVIFVLLFVAVASACAEDDPPMQPQPTPVTLQAEGFPPPPNISTENPLTEEGIALGRMLFYDARLSGNETQACAGCHNQAQAFSDFNQFSIGIDGLPGKRQAMAIFNMAWHTNGFFWDERAATVREQALLPIQDPLEMHETLENAMAKLAAVPAYEDAFEAAFGDPAITAERMGKAMEQFMFTLVSNKSKFDRVQRGEESFTASEARGLDLYNNEFDPTGAIKGAECFHCHGGFNFTNNRSMNNGLDSDAAMTDIGLEGHTGLAEDRGKFKVPSLRNIAVTAPYMHDGRFADLDAVLEHYNEGVVPSMTLDPLMQFNLGPGLGLSPDDLADLKAFLLTLTDDIYLNNPAYAEPLLP